MSRLSVRIFLAMMLANLLAMAGVFTVFDFGNLERQRQREHLRALSVQHYAERAEQALRTGHLEAADDIVRAAASESGLSVGIAGDDGQLIVGHADLPEDVSALVKEVETPHEQRRWHVVPLTEGRVALGSSVHASQLGISPPTFQILLVGLLSIVVSLLFARWLANPIRALRKASDRLAAGQSHVRVQPLLSATADAEVRALATDFDRMAERIEGLLESREQLLRDVSHELRSPLTRMTVALELARERANDASQPLLDRIEKECGRLNELVTLVLTMSRLEQMTQVESTTTVPLHALVREIAEDAAFEAASLDKQVEIATHQDVEVEGNEEILRQAIENVVRNAVRWTDPATRVSVDVRVSGTDTTRALVCVQDEGPGVPEAALEEIFSPFSRVEAARDRSRGGAGLGLAIADRAVRLHGGRIWASNREHSGLRVTLELPVWACG